MRIEVLTSEWAGYRLLDSGSGRKLEDFAGVRVIRSEPKAWWKPTLPEAEWRKAVGTHEDSGREGHWRLSSGAPKEWEAKLDSLRFQLKFMDNSKQVGIFPEQSPHWDWLSKQTADPANAILLDPPAFGRGPNGELWKIERDLAPLLRACRDILSPKARFVLLTVYTIDASSLLCGNLLSEMTDGLGGKVDVGELALKHDKDERLLPLSLWGRWQAR